MTIIEFLNQNDRFAAEAGAQLTEVSDGCATAVMKVEKCHLNAGGVCQGGAIFTVADLALAAVMNSHGQLTFGISSNVTFLQSAREGDTLTAEATETFNHHRIPFCEVRVTNQRGDLIAVLTGSAYRKKDVLPNVTF